MEKDIKVPKGMLPMQHQEKQPGKESKMRPLPIFDDPKYLGSGKLKDKVAIITGGDSGIGRAISIAYAKEGAKLAIVYLNENDDANQTKTLVEAYGCDCILIPIDLRIENSSKIVIDRVLEKFKKIDILVNNIAVQYPQDDLLSITANQIMDTFTTNVFSFIYMIKACLPYLKKYASIINTTSITAFHGSERLIDYSATKGAIYTLTKSLSTNLVKKEIRVNCVAPGPIWTPLIPSSFTKSEVAMIGNYVPMKRIGQPFELAPAYVYLASNDSTYVTGQVIHVNGGLIV